MHSEFFISEGRVGGWLLGCGYIGARTDATHHSGQTPDKGTKINHIIVYERGYTDTDPTGTLSPNHSQLSGPTK
jgi:hypothetical protein